MTDINEAETILLARQQIALLERIADRLDSQEVVSPEPTPPPKGMCVLCDMPVRFNQPHMPAPSGPGVRHAVAEDCPPLQDGYVAPEVIS